LDIDKKGLYSLITLITLIITQSVLSFVGIENISVKALVSLLVVVCLLVIYGTYKDGKKGAGIKYNITVAILLVLTCISSGIVMIMSEWYPDFLDKHDLLFLAFQLISFFALMLFAIIYRIVYELKKRK